MNRRIKIVLITITNNIINFVISQFRQDENLVVFGSWFGKRFSDNSRYLFTHLNAREKYRCVWVTEDDLLRKELLSLGYICYKRKSLCSVISHIRAKYHIVDQSGKTDILGYLSTRAVKINLWHGFPLKKILSAVDPNYKNEPKLGNWHEQYILATSKISADLLSKSFVSNRIKFGMYPRCHYLMNGSDDSLLSSERTFIEKIARYKKRGYKIVIYLPTFRDKGGDKLLNATKAEISDFVEQLRTNKVVLVYKGHYANEFLDLKCNDHSEDIISIPSDNDIYPFMKLSDLLITDYSSVYFDFLYLNRPIVFYPYDLELYENVHRGFNVDYNKYTPGEKVYNIQELLKSILDNLDMDLFKDKRESIKNEIFSEKDICNIFNNN
ncbi:CDP-glycerol glycerophosphotransferase family protein [Vibrio vulnificus]